MIIKICYKNENPISHKTYDTYMPIKIIDGKPYEVIKDARAIFDSKGNITDVKDIKNILEPITSMSFCGVEGADRYCYLDIIHYLSTLIEAVDNREPVWLDYKLEYLKNNEY